MNNAAEYLLDQQRLSRRLRDAPPTARELLLRKKEQIMAAVLAMDSDSDGEISRAEFEAGLRDLGVELSGAEAMQLFDALDADAVRTRCIGGRVRRWCVRETAAQLMSA